MHQRIGEILVDAGVIDAEQLKDALQEAAHSGTRVGEVLVSRAVCTEADIVEALARQFEIPVAPLATTVMIPTRVLELIPSAFALRRLCLPLFLDSHTGVLDVALHDPSSFELLDELRFMTGHQIRPMVAPFGELREAIRRFYEIEGEMTGPGISAVRDPSASAERTPRPTSPVGETYPETIFKKAGQPDELAAIVERTPHASAERPGLTDLAELTARVDRIYDVLAEAAAAHQSLVSMLVEQGVIDRAEFLSRVRKRLARRQGPGDGAGGSQSGQS
jgi:hypothetical protein